MPSPFSSFIASLLSFIPGQRLVDGGDVLALAKMVVGGNPDVTAKAGGGATLATPVNYGLTRVLVVASGNDSVILPPAIVGAFCELYNGGAQSLQVFGQQANQNGLAAGDQVCANNTVTPAAVATGVAQLSAVVAQYVCFTTGIWKQSLSA